MLPEPPVLFSGVSASSFNILAASNNTYLQNKILPAVLKGEIAGATGLSNAMKYLGGIEELRLQAKIEGENVTVNGFLPWASNLDSNGEFIVAVAAQTDIWTNSYPRPSLLRRRVKTG
jgi:hypothetical protein